MITVENLHKSFDGVSVLNDISAVFEKGKTNLVIGQSGSGKTVFLKCLLGLFSPDSGTIKFDHSCLHEMSIKERSVLRHEIGMVFQGSALFDSMTVEENVMFPMKMFTRKSVEEMRELANKAIQRVNLHEANFKMPNEISGGMKKRVAIARAIVMNPKYLFCDEPNSGLDSKTSILIDELICEITHEYNMTTVINTHDMNSVLQIGEKIIFLKQGHKEWEGNSKGILNSKNESVTDFVFSSELLKALRENTL